MDNIRIGSDAEQKALEFLRQKGMSLQDQNYIYRGADGKAKGEIDLIMNDNGVLVFVEVKKRAKKNHGKSIEMISQSKQSKLRRTALHYLQHKGLLDKMPCRFDIIGFDDDEMTWLVNAIDS